MNIRPSEIAKKVVTLALVSFFCLWACADGTLCSTGSDCDSGYCVGSTAAHQGVCCESACTGECEKCNAAGQCVLKTDTCGGTGVCAGQCDGSHATCQFPGVTIECNQPSCDVATNTATPPGFCNGDGTCTTGDPVSCAPGACGATACTECAHDADCGGNKHCDGGVCKDNLGSGTTCVTSSECASDHCVDGVCCDVACSGQCEACDVADHVGACTAVSGKVHGGRPPCAGVLDKSPCAGKCDGTHTNACAYPGGSVECPNPTPDCTNGACICQNGMKDVCDGKGSCFAPPSIRCPDTSSSTGSDTTTNQGGSPTTTPGSGPGSGVGGSGGSSQSSTTKAAGEGGCSCEMVGAAGEGSAAFFVALTLVVAGRRRRRVPRKEPLAHR